MTEGRSKMPAERKSTIYMDNAASTPVLDEVFQEMMPYLRDIYGNPSSLHSFGIKALQGINRARRQVASLIGAKPNEITFTSGGTESDNLAIKSTAYAIMESDAKRNLIISTSIEHEAILEPLKHLEKKGFEIIYLPVTREGILEPFRLGDSLSMTRTALVSIMFANNEIGTVQPIRELADITHRKGGNALFHSDAVQAVGKVPINAKYQGIDLLSISSHKLNGPKGVGALYIREGIRMNPLIHGGGQESLLRSGTENVHGIVGFGKACEIAAQKLQIYREDVTKLRDYLISKILKNIPYSRLNGSNSSRLPANAHFTFFGVNGEDLIIKLDEFGIAASTGSACSVKKQKPSHVLKAVGFSYEEITGSLRLSIGPQNTKDEIDFTVSVLSDIITELRNLSPFSASTTTK